MEWPPRSGAVRTFPEIDRAGWFDIATARAKLVSSQVAFLEELTVHLARFDSATQDGREDERA
jgi:predicted NUDIX family NTP pyrophosphohydrolase